MTRHCHVTATHLDIVHKGIVADTDCTPLHGLGVTNSQHVFLSNLHGQPLSRLGSSGWHTGSMSSAFTLQKLTAHLSLDGLLKLASVHLTAFCVDHDGHCEPATRKHLLGQFRCSCQSSVSRYRMHLFTMHLIPKPNRNLASHRQHSKEVHAHETMRLTPCFYLDS